MNNDSYKIIISLSHHRIAVEYWQRDGEDKLVPMPNMNWPVPLAFYCSPNGIEIGEIALRAIHSGTSNAFDNYFERLTNNETYLYGGQNKPLRYLLFDAIETIFEEFFRIVLLGNRGSLIDNRATMPITLVCESDIKPNERVLLLELFKSSGYNRFKVVEYNTFIEEYLRSSIATEYACDNVLVAWTEGSDLTLTLFDLRKESERRHEFYPGLGVDPRLDYVKQLIWERIKGQNPWLNFASEEDTISKVAYDFLTSTVPLINDTIILSDGYPYHYSIDRKVIDNLHCPEGDAIRSKLEDFLRESNLSNRNKILLLLRGVAAGNKFFEQTICQGFNNTIRSDTKLRNSTMRLLIDAPNPVMAQEPAITITETSISSKTEVKESEKIDIAIPAQNRDETIVKALKRKLKEIDAQSSGLSRDGRIDDAINLLERFKSESSCTDGFDEVVTQIDSKIFDLKHSVNTTTPIIDTSKVKSINQEWRELRAVVKGKVRAHNGHTAEAIKPLKNFITKISSIPGAETILAEANKLLSELETNEIGKNSSNRHNVGSSKPTGDEIRQKSHKNDLEKICPAPDEGEKLIILGKLKEARDWYRESGNTSKANILTNIIRAQKSVAKRKASVDEFKSTKNIEQINRIISELKNYISLCNEVKYDCSEYHQLLSEYKKLIK